MNKQKLLLAALVAAGFVSPMAYATNGDTMMAVGSESTALGGTGVAHYMGADSQWANPAMLGKSKGSEVTGGVVMFNPKVSNNGFSSVMADSQANVSYIPDVSFSSRTSDSLTYGIAMAGIAGMGVDYTNSAQSKYVNAFTSLSLMQLMATIAYNDKNYGVGISPVAQWGSLAIGYNNAAFGGGPYNTNHNADQYTGYGFNLGGYYDVTPDVTVAAAYMSEIEMKYGQMISKAGAQFGLTGASAFGDTLTQPAQMKAGISYNASNSITLTADYKLINWSGAKGYKDFNWKDQNVFAVGAKYAADGYWLGAGYNYADNPISALATGNAVYKDAVVNFFNNMMFPGVVQSSYTLGGGYSFTKAIDLDLAAVITPEVKTTVNVAGMGAGTTTNTTTHSQSSISASLRYKF